MNNYVVKVGDTVKLIEKDEYYQKTNEEYTKDERVKHFMNQNYFQDLDKNILSKTINFPIDPKQGNMVYEDVMQKTVPEMFKDFEKKNEELL
jgi:hypothetical protein